MTYFTMQELTASATAKARGIANIPGEAERKNLQTLVDVLLDPLRKAYGGPIIVTSGYRSKALNKAVGGTATSQHVKGQAVDIHAKDGNNKRLFELARKMGGFDQLIDENGMAWIHISYDPAKAKQRGQVLRYRNGRYTKI